MSDEPRDAVSQEEFTLIAVTYLATVLTARGSRVRWGKKTMSVMPPPAIGGHYPMPPPPPPPVFVNDLLRNLGVKR